MLTLILGRFILEIVDTTAPVIFCPESIYQEKPIVVYKLPEFSDNCSAEIILVEGLSSGETFPHGYTEVGYVVEDSSGNTAECSFMVLVNSAPIGSPDTTFIESWVQDITINVIDNDMDPDDDEFEVSDAWTISSATDASINGDGTVDYIIYEEDWCGTDTLVYIICDVFGAYDTVYSPIAVDCFVGVILPEGFSPNNDGVNDLFEIKGIQHFPNNNNNIQIFNRWGRLIFEKDSYLNEWNALPMVKGFLGGQKVPVGTYFVLLDLGDGSLVYKSYLHIQY